MYIQQYLYTHIPDIQGPGLVTKIPLKSLFLQFQGAWHWAFGCSQLTAKVLVGYTLPEMLAALQSLQIQTSKNLCKTRY